MAITRAQKKLDLKPMIRNILTIRGVIPNDEEIDIALNNYFDFSSDRKKLVLDDIKSQITRVNISERTLLQRIVAKYEEIEE